MGMDKYYANSNSSYYWSNPWRYCCYCGRIHNQDNRFCERHEEEEKGREKKEEPYVWIEKEVRFKKESRKEQEDRETKENFDKREEEDNGEYRREKGRPECCHHPYKQTHVHEFQGSTKLAEFDEDVHNHRVAGISGEAIRIPGGHVHKIWTRTDFFDHFHYIQQLTGPAIYVDEDEKADAAAREAAKGEAPHIHFIEGLTTKNDGHQHEFQFATLIESPLLPEEEVDAEVE